MSRRNRRPLTFASPERVAALEVLDDYDVARPWEVLSGGAAQAAIDAAVDVEEVTLRSESHTCLIEHVVAAADGAVFVFVLWETRGGAR